MTIPTFTITDTGPEALRFQDCREWVVQVWRSKFGDGAQTGSDSPDGVIIDQIALAVTLLHQLGTAIYSSQFFDSAVGDSLARIMRLVGEGYQTARGSTADVLIYGADATTIPIGTALQGPTGSDVYATLTEVTTSDAVRVLVIDGTLEAGDYDVTIGAATYTATQGAYADAEAVAGALITAINAGEGAGFVRALGYRDDGAFLVLVPSASGITITAAHSATASRITARWAVEAETENQIDGPRLALAGSILDPVVAVFGVDGTFNELDAVPGRFAETASGLKQRWLAKVSASGKGVPARIRAAVLEVDGVEFCRVYENETDAVDVDGRPRNSFEVVVLGGADAEIRAAILDTKPAGIKAWGLDLATIEDEVGKLVEIGFTRPTEAFVHVDVEITTGEGWDPIGDPETIVREALAEWWTSRIWVGADVYRVQIAAQVVRALEGVAGVTVELDATALDTDPPTFAAADLVIGVRDVAVFDSGRVSVTVLP